jgi:hypothetical protein
MVSGTSADAGRFVVGGATVVVVVVRLTVVVAGSVLGNAVEAVEVDALVGVELRLVRAERPPSTAVEIAVPATTPIRTAKPICPRRGQLRTCRQIVCTLYAKRRRARVYGVPLAEWSEQIIAVPAEISPCRVRRLDDVASRIRTTRP